MKEKLKTQTEKKVKKFTKFENELVLLIKKMIFIKDSF